MNINNLNYRPPMSYNEPNTKQESRTMTKQEMTKQEAIEILNNKGFMFCDTDRCGDFYNCEKCDEALNMAKEALLQEPIIPCKNCKHWHEWENGTGSCHRSSMWVGTDYDDYCSFAEPKGGDTE